MKKRIISLMLCAVMAVSCLAVPVFAEEPASSAETTASDSTESAEHTFTYVALGDSITAGVGLSDFKYKQAQIGYDVAENFEGYSGDCYVATVAGKLNLDRQHAINLGLPGAITYDIYNMVKYSAMPEMNQPSGTFYNYPQYQEYIRDADVVSIQIGANDALVPVIVSIGNATNWKSEQLANGILGGFYRNWNSETSKTFFDTLSQIKLTNEEKSALSYALGDGMRANINQAYSDVTTYLPKIVEEIRNINPDAKIVLVGYYNPVWYFPSWNNYFNKLRNYEKQLAKDEGLTYVDITWTETDNDAHPSIKGHRYIGEQLAKAISKLK